MEKTKSTVVILVLLSIQSFSQNQIAFVKYKSLSTQKELHNIWLQKDTVLYNHEMVYNKMYVGFPVWDERGTSRKETDTVKFNKEYKENLFLLEETISKYIYTNKRAYNSNIVNTYNEQPDLDKTYDIIDTLKKMTDWEILNDTCTFMNFKCQKATIIYDSVQYFAWFTTKLPYNAGPENFRGLPGLILNVFNKEGNKGFEAIEIQSPSKTSLPLFKIGEITMTYENHKRMVIENWNKEMEALKNIKVGERQKLN